MRASDTTAVGYETLCGYWEFNSGPLEEQSVLFPSESSLQPCGQMFTIIFVWMFSSLRIKTLNKEIKGLRVIVTIVNFQFYVLLPCVHNYYHSGGKVPDIWRWSKTTKLHLMTKSKNLLGSLKPGIRFYLFKKELSPK